MPEIKVKKKKDVEKREQQKRRAKIFLVKALIEDLSPEDARVVVKDLQAKAA